IYEVDKNIMRMGQPSMAIPLAYLSLKTIEVHNLIHIIEGIRYSIPIEDIKRRLSGIGELEDIRRGKVI
ncbi:MAG: synthase subunit, partial [Clostridia bacterium]|nr:synthase subunit [Clostridia bacterium]